MANSIFLTFDGTSSDASGNTTTVGTQTFGVGTGTTALATGTITTNVTPVSNTSIGSEDVLMSYSLPGASLAVNGRGVRVTAAGVFAGNTNVKRAKLYFGATVTMDTTFAVSAPNGTAWRFVMEVLRVGATAQIAITMVTITGTSGWTLSTTPAETLSGAVLIKVGGLSATAASDVTQQLLIVETL